MILEAWVKWRCHKFYELHYKDYIKEEFENKNIDAIILLELDWLLLLLSCFHFLEILRVLIAFICNEDDIHI